MDGRVRRVGRLRTAAGLVGTLAALLVFDTSARQASSAPATPPPPVTNLSAFVPTPPASFSPASATIAVDMTGDARVALQQAIDDAPSGSRLVIPYRSTPYDLDGGSANAALLSITARRDLTLAGAVGPGGERPVLRVPLQPTVVPAAALNMWQDLYVDGAWRPQVQPRRTVNVGTSDPNVWPDGRYRVQADGRIHLKVWKQPAPTTWPAYAYDTNAWRWSTVADENHPSLAMADNLSFAPDDLVTVDASAGPVVAKQFTQRPMLEIDRSQRIRVEGLSFVDESVTSDQLAGYTPYRTPFEAEHGIGVVDSSQVHIVDVGVTGVYGDGIALGEPNRPADDVVVERVEVVNAGRQGVSATSARRVRLDGVRIVRPTRSAFDLETEHVDPNDAVADVEIVGFDVVDPINFPFAAVGSQPVERIWIHDGQTTGGAGLIYAGTKDDSYPRRRYWRLDDIRHAPGTEPYGGSPQAAAVFNRIDDLHLRNVEMPVSAAQARRAISLRSVGGIVHVSGGSFGAACEPFAYAVDEPPIATYAVHDNVSDTAGCTFPRHAPVPVAPGNVTATVTGPRQVRVAWDDRSGDERWFEVQRRDLGGSWWPTGQWVQVALRPAGTTSHVDTSPEPSRRYEYRVVARADEFDPWPKLSAATTSAAVTMPAAEVGESWPTTEGQPWDSTRWGVDGTSSALTRSGGRGRAAAGTGTVVAWRREAVGLEPTVAVTVTSAASGPDVKVVARRADDQPTRYWTASAAPGGNSLVLQRVSGATRTTLGSVPFAAPVGRAYRVALSVADEATAGRTRLRAKAWLPGSAEPGWLVDVVDMAAGTLWGRAGRVGVAVDRHLLYDVFVDDFRADPEVRVASAADTFSTPQASGLGPAWALTNAAVMQSVSVAGGVAELRESQANPSGAAFGASRGVGGVDADQTVSFRADDGGTMLGLYARRAPSRPEDYYLARVRLGFDGIELFRVRDDQVTNQDPSTRTVIAGTPAEIPTGTWTRLRFAVVDVADVTELRLKWWPHAEPEPAAWGYVYRDRSTLLRGVVGRAGLRVEPCCGRTLALDDYAGVDLDPSIGVLTEAWDSGEGRPWGPAWQSAGEAGSFTASGGTGRVTGGGARRALRADSVARDVDASVTLTVPSTATAGLITRVHPDDPDTWYEAVVDPTAARVRLLRVDDGSTIELGSAVLLPMGSPVRLRFFVAESTMGRVTVRLKAWALVAGATEPSTWTLSRTDVGGLAGRVGRVGVIADPKGQTVVVDDFRVVLDPVA